MGLTKRWEGPRVSNQQQLQHVAGSHLWSRQVQASKAPRAELSAQHTLHACCLLRGPQPVVGEKLLEKYQPPLKMKLVAHPWILPALHVCTWVLQAWARAAPVVGKEEDVLAVQRPVQWHHQGGLQRGQREQREAELRASPAEVKHTS